MSKVITVREASTSADSDNDIVVFSVEVGPVHFGFLYLTSESYTLAWDGALDFRYLHEKAHFFLYKQSAFEFDLEDYDTRVALIVSNELKKFTYERSDQPNNLKALLDKPNQISFARYDFQLKSSTARYSFTAENPQATLSDHREVAVMLAREQPLSKRLLRWAVGNHVAFRDLKLGVDYHASFDNLNYAIVSGKALSSD